MIGIKLPTILLILLISLIISAIGIPLALLQFTKLDWLKVYTSENATALSTFSH